MLTEIFASRKHTELLEFLLENRDKIFTQSKLSEYLRCSPSTISRVVDNLKREGIILEERLGTQLKIIALNLEREKVKILIDF